MKLTITHVKVVHTVIFWVLSTCVAYALYSALTNDITRWTWLAVALVVVEGLVLLSCGWTCPLTIVAERLGATRGSVADIFLPKWFADRIFPICGTTYLVACVILVLRLVR